MNTSAPFSTFVSRLNTRWMATRLWLNAMPEWRWVALSAFVAIALSVCFLAPKLWILRQPMPGSFEWDRALTFIEQSKAPWMPALEPAMRSRILPGWVAYLLGLRGTSCLVLPWLGLLVWLGVTACLVGRRSGDRLAGSACACLFATSGSAIAMTNWWGLNDGWYLVGLSVVTLGRSPFWLAAVTLLCPWVDERLLMALPLAWICRRCLVKVGPLQGASRGIPELALLGTCIVVYAVARLTLLPTVSNGADAAFLRSVLRDLPHYISFAPLGWFMGWRSGWLFIVLLPAWLWISGRRSAAGGVSAAIAITAASMLLVASDTSRSVVVLAPVILAAVVACATATQSVSMLRSLLFATVLANLLMPYLHVSHAKISNVNSLPLELVRLRSIPRPEGN